MMRADQEWPGQGSLPHTIMCVVNLVVTFEFPFNDSVKGTKFRDGRYIVGCQMGVDPMMCHLN